MKLMFAKNVHLKIPMNGKKSEQFKNYHWIILTHAINN
jgi:hypothetical protein